jgi:hypothetical protein
MLPTVASSEHNHGQRLYPCHGRWPSSQVTSPKVLLKSRGGFFGSWWKRKHEHTGIGRSAAPVDMEDFL